MLNNREKPVIFNFLKNLEKYDGEIMTLIWGKQSKIIATFDTCFEDENDCDINDDSYEEFMSFAFTVISIEGEAPVYITEDNCFLVSYHNFPDEIFILNGKKIN